MGVFVCLLGLGKKCGSAITGDKSGKLYVHALNAELPELLP